MPARLAFLVSLFLSTGVLVGCGNDDDPAPSTSTVTSSERTWVDITRATPRTSRFPGEPQRRLRVRLWYPSPAHRLPLLVMAHGYGGSPEKFDAFARFAAAAGFVVAAPAFPLTNENAPGGHEVGLPDTISQPGDLSFVITALLQANQTAGDPLAGLIKPSDIAVLGHSLGGVTAIALTRLASARDARVKATVWVAPVAYLLDLFWPGEPLAADGPPTLLIQGTADTTVPYAGSEALYAELSPPRFFVGLEGAGHSEGLESQLEPPIPARRDTQRATVAFLDAMLRGRAAELQTALATLAADGQTVQMEER